MKSLGARVEVKVKSLHGILWSPDVECCSRQPSSIAATVSFAGSAPTMEVSSLAMCGYTGHLVIESNKMEFDLERGSEQTYSPASNNIGKKFRLVAGFLDETDGDDFSVTDRKAPPHLQLELPPRDPRIQETCHSQDLPEIVELHISIRKFGEDCSVEEGIAHLVLFGNKAQNCCIDLPIKRKKNNIRQSLSIKPAARTSTHLGTNAFVRIHVRIFPEHPSDLPQTTATRKNMSNMYSRRLAGILEQLRQNEECAAERAKAAKCELVDPRTRVHDLHNIEILKRRGPSSRFLFCSSFEIMHSIQSFLETIRGCGARKSTKNIHGIVLTAESFMESTIATRASYDI